MWTVLAALTMQADDLTDKLLSQGIAEFTAAYQAWEADRFGAAAELFRQASTHTPTSSAACYWLGTAEFHRMLQIRSLPPTAAADRVADGSMEAALTAFTAAIRLEACHAESHALLGTLYGMKIDGNLVRALRFGPRVQKHRSQAMTFGADNPRVRYLLGTCQFHLAKKPAAQREALASLLAAEALFALEAQRQPGPLEPRWGYSSCLTFIARTYELLGQSPEAADYYRRALAQQPSDHLAREGLGRVSPKN